MSGATFFFNSKFGTANLKRLRTTGSDKYNYFENATANASCNSIAQRDFKSWSLNEIVYLYHNLFITNYLQSSNPPITYEFGEGR